jgi:hypothetical protein
MITEKMMIAAKKASGSSLIPYKLLTEIEYQEGQVDDMCVKIYLMTVNVSKMRTKQPTSEILAVHNALIVCLTALEESRSKLATQWREQRSLRESLGL